MPFRNPREDPPLTLQSQHDAVEEKMVDNDGPSASNVESSFENIISLVMARSRGEVASEDVESALNSIIPMHERDPAPSAPPQVPVIPMTEIPASTASKLVGITKRGDIIIADEGNYDDDDNDDGGDYKPQAASPDAPIKRGRGRPPKKKDVAEKKEIAHDKTLGGIPLGRMGKRMLITFGDGPYPRPEVISAVLLGARSSLQRAILDARALRRKEKDQWHLARANATLHTKDGPKTNLAKVTGANLHSACVDNEMSFKALESYDRLIFDVPCGFDVAQLEKLFPEEMGAYQRWKKVSMMPSYVGVIGDGVTFSHSSDFQIDAQILHPE